MVTNRSYDLGNRNGLRMRTQRTDEPPPGFLSELYRNLPAGRHFDSQREFEADWIRAMRKRHQMTQASLAERLNISPQTVQNWENPLCQKWIASHNQSALKSVDRQLWMERHILIVSGPLPQEMQFLFALIKHGEDRQAQELGAYLLQKTTDLLTCALIHHALHFAYRLQDRPDPVKAREHVHKALECVPEDKEQCRRLLQNADLRFRWVDIMEMPFTAPDRLAKAESVLATCEELFCKDPQALFLWNALEVACHIRQIADAKVLELIEKLRVVEGEKKLLEELRLAEYSRARKLYCAGALGGI